ncbi:hypothetical protein J6590_033857 [Homalodisca vitripennis]|nr:hypothetical protein J6590_033857 [Homalodisca vitripennis]
MGMEKTYRSVVTQQRQLQSNAHCMTNSRQRGEAQGREKVRTPHNICRVTVCSAFPYNIYSLQPHSILTDQQRVVQKTHFWIAGRLQINCQIQ